MAKIYFNRYMDRVKDGEITVAEAIGLAETEVHPRWRAAVIALLREKL